MSADFAFIDELVEGIRWDAKYATWDNFTGRPVDGYLANRIVGTVALCEALARARDEAATHGLGLLIWDAYRPRRAVEAFLRWSQEPDDGATKQRHYPRISRADMIDSGYVAPESGHSRGGTVDLTLFRLADRELVPMGGGHDLMDVRSHHGAAGVGEVEAANREHLRSIMATAGFAPFENEWWHYSLIDEPFPETSFDFVIR